MVEPPYFRYHYSVPGPNNSLIDTYDLVTRDEFIRRSGGIDPLFDKNTMTYQTYKFGQPDLCI